MDCDVVETSRKLLNAHFKASHDKLFCKECGQIFNVPSTLEWHMYMYTIKEQFPCTHCNKVFPFASNLQIHMFKHTTVAGYQCGHGNCKKWFKQKGEQDKHAATHTSLMLSCGECDYVSNDIRNLCRHGITHKQEGKLPCERCGKLFKWHMQRKRHVAANKCKAIPEPNNDDI